jgi:hypothetical protein
MAVALGGCQHQCKPNTLFLDLELDSAASEADQLTVSVASGGKSVTAQKSHSRGVRSGSLEIDFAGGYVKGARVDVTIIATQGAAIVGRGHETGFMLQNGCSALTLSIASAGLASGLPDMATSDATTTTTTAPMFDMTGFGPQLTLQLNATNKIDILFMVDNSPSMDPMQAQLQAQFSSFLDPFVSLAKAGYYTDLHIGVVTSDYGAGAVASTLGGCDKSPGGQRGLLQAVGAAAASGCMGPTGSPFISYQFGPNGDTSNLPGGNTPQALAQTFTCMASVGVDGCGFEHQLESVYQALNNTFENGGFLRDDALLAVVFFTNEDDGSASPTSTFYDPDPAKQGTLGGYDTYRQTRFAVGCGNPFMLTPYGDSMGYLTNCLGAPNPMVMDNLAYDVSRYTQLLTQPKSKGGIKSDPNNVVLVAIDAPETQVEIVQVAANTGNGKGSYPNPASYQPCAAPGVVDGRTCLVRLQHSCQNTTAPGFFGDPAVRLNSVVRAARYNQVFSICGDTLAVAPDYSRALSATGNLLRTRMLANCLPNKLADTGNPVCDVIASTTDSDGVVHATVLPRCDQGAPPCWHVQAQNSCASSSPDGVAVLLTTSAPLPAGTTISASCR